MLKKLRLKFVIINMAIVTAMLCVIFGLVYHSTRVDLEQENLAMMRAIAAFPALDRPGRPDQPPEEVRLPYFVLEVGADGAVSLAFGIPQGKTGNVMYATFDIDPETGLLTMICSWNSQIIRIL